MAKKKAATVKCPECKGKGATIMGNPAPGGLVMELTCYFCEGTGKLTREQAQKLHKSYLKNKTRAGTPEALEQTRKMGILGEFFANNPPVEV